MNKYRVVSASGLPQLLNWSHRKRPLVLAFHGIFDGPKKLGVYPPTFIHVDDLNEKLIYIKKKYHVLSPQQFLIHIDQNSPFPKHSVLVTFDDGYENYMRLAVPLLQQHNIKSIVFIPSKYIEENKPFWYDVIWLFFKYGQERYKLEIMDMMKISNLSYGISLVNQALSKLKRMLPQQRDNILEKVMERLPLEKSNFKAILKCSYPMTLTELKNLLKSEGTTFGGHTHTHTILTVLSDNNAEQEIRENKKRLEEYVGEPCHFFAYPNGGAEDFNDFHEGLLKKMGYKAAFSLRQQRSLVHRNVMNISRINVVPEDSVESLAFRCTGITKYTRFLKKFAR